MEDSSKSDLIKLIFMVFYLANTLLFMAFSIDSYKSFNPNYTDLRLLTKNW